jgi:hypothetical protein
MMRNTTSVQTCRSVGPLAIILLLSTLIVLSCATTPETRVETRKIRTQRPSGATSTTSNSSNRGGIVGESGFYRLPEVGPGFWTRMISPEIAYQYRAINGVSKCTIFVGDMLNEHFERSVFTRVFPEGMKGANDTYVDWIYNGNLIRLTPDEYSIADIQELVDKGYLVLMAYFYPEIAGHVAFVGNSNLKLFTVPPIGGLEGKNGRALDPAWYPVMVQAGTYTGVTSMVYATNGWLRNNNYGSGVVRYYAVRAH